ncbi:glycosyltransferase [Kineococcus xinjiangensis]|uniref:glycosyltransferase n=1 Tax=Kineococcus xinjiangensis TaxID=512762 RepID=UPI001304EE2B|nr:glycosyltransferase [Kineococcus xinjiangensis]
MGTVRELYRSPEHEAAAGDFDITVTVCFASNRDTLGETVTSLQHQRGAPRFELLLVSNATHDDSVEIAREASRGLPTRIVECESAGYDSNARNVCMVESAAAKTVFLDADDTVNPGYVAAMSAALDSSAMVTAIWDSRSINADRFPQLRGKPADDASRWPFRHQGWTFAPAGTLGFRREVPETIGGFDPELLFGANNEWCFRAYAAGFEIAAAPDAIVHYRLRPSARQAMRQRYRWGVSEVAAAQRAEQYGMPRRTRLRAMGVGTYGRLLARLVRVRDGYDVYEFLSAAGQAAGHVTGSLRYRRLDL